MDGHCSYLPLSQSLTTLGKPSGCMREPSRQNGLQHVGFKTVQEPRGDRHVLRHHPQVFTVIKFLFNLKILPIILSALFFVFNF